MSIRRSIKPNAEEILQKFEQDPTRREAIRQANAEAITSMKRTSPVLVGIGKAKDHVPGMRRNLVLHAGPPISWKRASGPMKGAIIGGLIFEGLAKDKDDAVALMESGEVDLEPCHDHDAVAPMAGIITYSMSVFIVEDQPSGQRTYSNISDDLGDFLGSSVRFGVYREPAVEHLHWIESTLAPILGQAIEEAGSIDFLPLVGRSLLMGDDCHVIMNAATPLFLKELMPGLIKACPDQETLAAVTTLIYNDGTFALNPIMATCKAISIAGSNVSHSSIVTVMARNGTDFGIKVSGLGDTWFTGLAEVGRGFYLMPGISPADVNRDMGDSAITETVGLGGVVKSVSGTAQHAIDVTMRMYQIVQSESDAFRVPALDGRGSPMGFDIFKIIESGIRPAINSGLAHKHMNRPMAGLGYLHPPMEAFVNAAVAFNEVEL
ncbi:MAG: DUF1116 domain-containing protein [Actinomycetota bacterium]|nr:DUF1116 domain-containing protein [Actinomycetota bacterium]